MLRPPELIFNGALTESSSFYLLRGEGKHREQLHHNLNDDICHHFGRWNVDIDVEAFQEVAQAFEEVAEGIIIRTDFAGSLTYPCVTRGLVVLNRRTVRRTSIPTKIAFAGGKG